ncbi:MAG: hypothetical protein NC823_02210, partial [Candidatus Omnitrophica bacterium]|nr:hypothetical protein [Candidatus Omnitrophota bacterium]
ATCLAPLLIILHNPPLFPAMLHSIQLVRRYTDSLVILLTLIGIPSAFAITSMRKYNARVTPGTVENLAWAVLLAFLEIVTIQSFFGFLTRVESTID